MKIFVDELIPNADETFGAHGELIRFSGRTVSSADFKQVDALIVRSTTKVDSELFSDQLPKFVGSCTIGFDHLDRVFLEDNGIFWITAPGCNAQSVAEYGLCAVAALNRLESTESVGIVGCGQVGRAVKNIWKKLNCEIRIYDPLIDQSLYPELTELHRVMECDLVCIHAPITVSGGYPTKGMIGKNELSSLSQNAVLLSAGRGGIVDETALTRMIDREKEQQFIFDVWEGEPTPDTGLVGNVDIATPHIAGHSVEGKLRGTHMVYKQFCRQFGLKEPSEKDTPEPLVVHYPGSITKLILDIYNPITDSQAMKKALIEPENPAKIFDSLRVNHQQRHEFSRYRVVNVPSDAKKTVEALGFEIIFS